MRHLQRSLLALAVLIAASTFLHAQTFSVIHAFTGESDGFQPYDAVMVDGAGNLYGTTTESVRGSVFQMKPRDNTWTFATLYQFGYGETIPQGRLVQGPGGALYGTTSTGGNYFCTEFGCGLVYGLRAPQTICRSVSCPWNATLTSLDGPNGLAPGIVTPVFDSAGNMYITTTEGGSYYAGNVVELTGWGGNWTPNSIYNFSGSDGSSPYSGIVFDAQGNIYGTTWMGGPNSNGTVYRLTPSGGNWFLQTLYSFPNSGDGKYPVASLLMDASGNLYGTTEAGGSGGGGTVFELSPSGGGWTFTVLYSFSGQDGPLDTLAMDAAGNLYGTTFADGAYNEGSVFKLTRNNGSWSFTDLHDFTGGPDGAYPVGGVTLGSGGVMFGTAAYGAVQNCPSEEYPGCGTVWEITP
jgi:uncharacterized repeat protein (TIGR03803 family)